MRVLLISISVCAILLIQPAVILAQWTNGQNAQYVAGQPNFTTYTSGSGSQSFSLPMKVAIDFTNNKMYVADGFNHRVLRFAYPITSNQPTAERIFGTGTGGASQNQFQNIISAVAVYNGTLWVCDQNGNRILKFNNAFSASTDAPDADAVLGQGSGVNKYTTISSGTTDATFFSPTDIFIDESGNMWVVDNSNSRVLKFNDVNNKSDGAIADLVLGQSDFLSSSQATTQSGMKRPTGVCVTGTGGSTVVWVADGLNNRVLRYDNPTINGASANGVLGQSDYTSSSGGTTSSKFSFSLYPGLSIDNSGRLYVSDYGNSRIMIFDNAAGKSDGASANNVLGQSNFTTVSTSNGGQNHFYYGFSGKVYGVTVDNSNNLLLVADGDNNRVMIFNANSALPVELSSFTASVNGNNVNLKWQTATEVNNYGFNVERSNVKGQTSNWQKVGFVAGHGNSNSPKSYTFTDQPTGGTSFSYRLKQIDNDGGFKYYDAITVSLTSSAKAELMQNSPNPFNPSTTIKFYIPNNSDVSIKIYDILGREVNTLINRQTEAGYHIVYWNGKNKYGSDAASGVYLYRLTAVDPSSSSPKGQAGQVFTETKKMNLLK